MSCISLQSACPLPLCPVYRQTPRKCQRCWQKWSSTLLVIWQIIIDFFWNCYLSLMKIWNVLLSLCLMPNFMAWVYLSQLVLGHGYQSRCPRRLPSLNVLYCLAAQTYVSLKPEAIKILRLWVFSTWISTSSYVTWRNCLSTLPPTFPFTLCQAWPSAQGMVVVASTAEC